MVAWAAIGAGLKAAAPALGKFAGSALGGLFGGSSGSSVGYDINSSKELMRYQDELTRNQTQWLNENSYKQMRTGLENAGYNPLMALGATPQAGSVGLGSPMSSNTANYSGADAISSLLNMANIANVQADTDTKSLGVITKYLGTKYGKMAGKLVDKLLDNIQNTAKVNDKIKEAGSNVLKGYVSNDASFDYAPEYDELGKLPPELSRYK